MTIPLLFFHLNFQMTVLATCHCDPISTFSSIQSYSLNLQDNFLEDVLIEKVTLDTSPENNFNKASLSYFTFWLTSLAGN